MMTPQTQEFPVHSPERGLYGDCLRAALASLIDVPISQVPHFVRDHRADVAGTTRAVNQYLAKRGLILTRCDYTTAAKELAELRMHGAGDCYHLILGTDHDGDPHACVGLNGKIVHDPHPLRRGMADHPSKWSVGLLIQTGTKVKRASLKEQARAAERVLTRGR